MAAVKTDNQHRAPNAPALGFRFLLLAGLSILLLVIDNRENYLDNLRKAIGASVHPLRVVVDAANGAAYKVAPAVFQIICRG